MYLYKGDEMLELGIAQAQFTQLLNQTVLIVDKKSHHNKAVILPYAEYVKLRANVPKVDKNLEEGVFSQFVGILDNNFKTTDIKYNEILN